MILVRLYIAILSLDRFAEILSAIYTTDALNYKVCSSYICGAKDFNQEHKIDECSYMQEVRVSSQTTKYKISTLPYTHD